MGFKLFGFLKKKKEGEGADGSTPAEGAAEASPGGGGGGGGEIGKIQLDLIKMKAQIDSFAEIRKSFSERFSTMNEQIGEIRGQLMDTNRTLGLLEVKATKAADLVESVHPDKLMIQVQKEDGKIEALRGILESKDAIMQNIMDQLKQIRTQITLFKGIEEILKTSEEVKSEVAQFRKTKALIERHVDRIENVFLESQKTFREFNNFQSGLEAMKGELKELSAKMDKMDVAVNTFIKKKDFEERIGRIESSDKHLKKVLAEIEEAAAAVNKRFREMKEELRGEFDRKIYKAEVLSDAFEALLKDNPLFAKGLKLDEFLSTVVKEEERVRKELDRERGQIEKEKEKEEDRLKKKEAKEEKEKGEAKPEEKK